MSTNRPRDIRGSGVYFATSNPLKLSEALSLAPGLVAFDCDLPEMQEVSVIEVVRDKIKIVSEMNVDFPVFVEDTGLEISSLGNLPGALVKWFIRGVGAEGLARMALSNGNPVSAVAVSAVAAYCNGKTLISVGRVNGLLVAPRGKDFGWNSVFQPCNHDLTFGEMTDTERLAHSMRRSPILDSLTWIESEMQHEACLAK